MALVHRGSPRAWPAKGPRRLKWRVELLHESQTFWLNQKRFAALFGVEVHTIDYRVKEIHASGELGPPTTLRKIRGVQIEGICFVYRGISF